MSESTTVSITTEEGLLEALGNLKGFWWYADPLGRLRCFLINGALKCEFCVITALCYSLCSRAFDVNSLEGAVHWLSMNKALKRRTVLSCDKRTRAVNFDEEFRARLFEACGVEIQA